MTTWQRTERFAPDSCYEKEEYWVRQVDSTAHGRTMWLVYHRGEPIKSKHGVLLSYSTHRAAQAYVDGCIVKTDCPVCGGDGYGVEPGACRACAGTGKDN